MIELQSKELFESHRGQKNFSEINYKQFYDQQRIAGYMFINKPDKILKITHSQPNLITFIPLHIKNDIQNYIQTNYYPIQKTFLQAVLLGKKANMPYNLKQIFINTGTIHILVIAGLHIGLIALIFFYFFQAFGITKNVSHILIIIIIILFNFIIGYKDPIVRATIMFIVFILCYIFDRDRITLNALAIAALIILLIDPLTLKNISFQLSFSAVAGIIIFTTPLNKIIDKYIKIKNKYVIYFKDIFVVSIALQIFLMPIMLIHFKQFPYISIIANLFAIPLTTLILFLTIFSYLFFHIIPFISYLLALCSNFFISLLIVILQFFNYFKPIIYPYFSLPMLCIYVIIIIIVFRKTFFHYKFVWSLPNKIIYPIIIFLTILLCLIAIYPYYSLSNSNKNDSFEMNIFNISGNSVLIKSPNNKYILFNCGYKNDMEKHIAPFLIRNKILIIDSLFLSDFSKKCCQGFFYLPNQIKINKIYLSKYQSSYFRQDRINEIINQNQISINSLQAGNELIIEQIHFLILNPNDNINFNIKNKNLNSINQELIIQIKYKTNTILLVPVLSTNVEKYLIQTYNKNLKAEVFSLQNYYENDPYFTPLLNLIQPQYIIVNKKFSDANKGNKYIFKQQLQNQSIESYFLNENGAIKIIFDGNLNIKTSYQDKQ